MENDLLKCDYLLGQTCCALYLSVQYHRIFPSYIYDRFNALKDLYKLRILLLHIDVNDTFGCLKELSRVCIKENFTLILVWSYEEAARYLETFKAYEFKPADAIMEPVEVDKVSRTLECLASIKSVNKTDALTLLTHFKTLGRIMMATREELALCPGIGHVKANRIADLFESRI